MQKYFVRYLRYRPYEKNVYEWHEFDGVDALVEFMLMADKSFDVGSNVFVSVGDLCREEILTVFSRRRLDLLKQKSKYGKMKERLMALHHQAFITQGLATTACSKLKKLAKSIQHFERRLVPGPDNMATRAFMEHELSRLREQYKADEKETAELDREAKSLMAQYLETKESVEVLSKQCDFSKYEKQLALDEDDDEDFIE